MNNFFIVVFCHGYDDYPLDFVNEIAALRPSNDGPNKNKYISPIFKDVLPTTFMVNHDTNITAGIITLYRRPVSKDVLTMGLHVMSIIIIRKKER